MAPSLRSRPGLSAAARLLLVLGVAAIGSACASGGAGPTTASSATGGSSAAPGGSSVPPESGSTSGGRTVDGSGNKAGAGPVPSSNAEVASIEFVSTAVAGSDASGYLASTAIDDPALGAPYTRAGVAARLTDLSGLVEGRATVRPSTTAHPASATGPACDEGPSGSTPVCDIEVLDGSGRLRATVVVHWADSGVSDFVIVDPADTGAPGGVGRAVCSPGFTLLVGGHTVDRFDVAICTDAKGAVEYQGANRENGQGITITACAAGSDVYRASNNGFGYTVNGTVGRQRGQLTVLNPSGANVLDTTFTPYRTTPAGPLTPC